MRRYHTTVHTASLERYRDTYFYPLPARRWYWQAWLAARFHLLFHPARTAEIERY